MEQVDNTLLNNTKYKRTLTESYMIAQSRNRIPQLNITLLKTK